MVARDDDGLVAGTVRGHRRHEEARRLLEGEVGAAGNRLGIVPQVLHELIHVVTDDRRLSEPLAMADAVEAAERLWTAPETGRLAPRTAVSLRTLELLRRHRLGRKRILDTALAANLEASGVRRLATWHRGDFEIFPFLEVVRPPPESASAADRHSHHG